MVMPISENARYFISQITGDHFSEDLGHLKLGYSKYWLVIVEMYANGFETNLSHTARASLLFNV